VNANSQQSEPSALKRMYTKPRRSAAWEEVTPPVVRFWTDDGDCWGFPFHHLTATHYCAKDQRLLIDWALGTIMVVGPKALDFYDDFSNHCATLVKADGKDILSVTMHLRSEADAEADAEAIIPELTDDDRSLGDHD
jgi:hypothetical protein